MVFIFLIVGILGCICIIGYFFIKNKTQTYKKKLKITNIALKEQAEREAALREEIKTLQDKLTTLFKDSVTDLFGWDLFEDRLGQALRESARYQLIMSVFLVDINNFKVVNQALGQEVGDALLKEAAKRIQACVRKVDSVSRFTEDIFAILLTQLTKKESAAIVAQRILQTMSESFLVGKHELYITVSIGIALYPGDGEDGSMLMRNADYAMQLAKQVDKSHYQFYQKELYINSQRDLAVSMCFNKGPIFQETSIFYQPIFDCNKQKIISMEMSLCWQYSESDSMTENEFFPLAKQQRKLSALSEWIIEQATKTFFAWNQKNFNPEFIVVPLSIHQLEDNHFIYQLSHIFQKYDFDPAHLLVEIRGNICQIPLDVLEKSFNMLRYLGVKVAIDKFGIDAFPLAFLKYLSVGYLKLDQTLIQDINTNQKSRALVKSMVILAKNLSIQVIAPGVTSPDQAHTLKELECFLLQGEWLGSVIEDQAVLATVNKFEN